MSEEISKTNVIRIDSEAYSILIKWSEETRVPIRKVIKIIRDENDSLKTENDSLKKEVEQLKIDLSTSKKKEGFRFW
jgi:regulator of replication initiation timing